MRLFSVLNQRLWQPYLRALDSYPLVTKSLSTAALMGTGDVIAQRLEYHYKSPSERMKTKGFEVDVRRALTMTGVGAFFSGPLLHFWYKRLDILVRGEGALVVVKKLALDQLAFAPVVISAFIGLMGTLNGKTPSQCIQAIQNDLFFALKANWTLWPLANAINFALIPPSLRVLYVSTVSVFWNIFLSNLGNKKHDEGSTTSSSS
ncbi:hypothetical protein SAMD00019534_052010, partial [Acytostelium subglobosum LB1]|uniref:hypothetical protein n=1 Tax=Acytostelium subglobosum LB1 TaxID=1410327 RepID=UPI0006451C8C